MRKVIPNKKVKKKASFKKLTEDDVALLCSHVNSYSRPILDHKTPIGLAKRRLPDELFKELGIMTIEPKNVLLKNPPLQCAPPRATGKPLPDV